MNRIKQFGPLQRLISALAETFLTRKNCCIVLDINFRKGASEFDQIRMVIRRTPNFRYSVTFKPSKTSKKRTICYKYPDRVLQALVEFSGKSNLYFHLIEVYACSYRLVEGLTEVMIDTYDPYRLCSLGDTYTSELNELLQIKTL